MIETFLGKVRRWFSDTPLQALEQAYQAALTIKAIENKHFNGQKVSADSDWNDSTVVYFNTEIQKYLKIAQIRLAEFKSSGLYKMFLDLNSGKVQLKNQDYRPESAVVLEKVAFIEKVIARYVSGHNKGNELSKNNSQIRGNNRANSSKKTVDQNNYRNKYLADESNTETVSDKTGVLPRSFLRTFNRIKQEIEPNSEETEEKVLSKFRSSRNKTLISIKFFLLLIIIPLLTHQVTKSFLISPIVEYYYEQHSQVIFINQDYEEEAFLELQRYEENLRFRSLLGLSAPLSPQEREESLKEKASEIAESYRHRGADAIENIFADIFSLVAFATVIAISKREILIVKSFLDEITYSLSDSAKAFLIILVTDIFVGYHSPHGWEVILEGIASHFGLPENREFNFLFIATFPVILDTVLKYWIFRYLNRISPSAVATYRNMNE